MLAHIWRRAPRGGGRAPLMVRWASPPCFIPPLPLPPTSPLALGDLVHRLLQTWDFRETAEACRSRIGCFIESTLAGESSAKQDQIKRELYGIFDRFCRSEIYRELSEANILGREVPLLM